MFADNWFLDMIAPDMKQRKILDAMEKQLSMNPNGSMQRSS